MSKILLIEDDQFIVKMYKTKLELEGFEVVTAANGEEGLQKLAEAKPDLILLDLMMPKMDGFEFLRNMKRMKDDKLHTTTIVFTNLGQEPDVQEAKELGVSDYLIKADTTPQLVVDKIKHYIGSK